MYFKRKINLLKKGFLKEKSLANKSFLIKAVIVLLLTLFFNLVQANSIPTKLSQADSISTKLSQAEKSIGKAINRNYYGTGFFISKKHFVTNLHVLLRDQSTLSAEPIDESDFYIQQKESSEFLKIKKVLHISAIYDFALLEIETEVSNYLKLGKLEKQEELHVFGYPGKVFKRMIKKKKYPIRLEGPTYSFPINHSDLPGSSGSPVLNKQGEVVGLISQAALNLLTIVIQPDTLKDLIEGDLGLSCLDFINIRSCINEELKKLKNESRRGNALAQYRLAQDYLKNKETEENKEKAFYWYQESAKQGNAPAQHHLAFMYYYGDGIEKSKEKAFYWTQKSAKQAYAPAQYMLAVMYDNADGIEKSKEKAFYWYQESAKQSNAQAQYRLAFMYYYGEGIIKKSKKKAFYWAQKSAKQGNAQAQDMLANMYYYGDGIKKSKKKAFDLFQKAALQGSASSQHMLSVLFPKTSEGDNGTCANLFKLRGGE